MSGDGSDMRPYHSGAVLDAIARLWESDGSARKSRGCLATLAILEDAEPTPEAVLDAVMAEYPCRMILIREGAPDAAETIRFRASVHCGWRRGGRICCERVTLLVRPDARGAVANCVEALAVAGMPRVGVVRTAAVETWAEAFPSLDRLVGDSTRGPGLFREAFAGQTVSDIAWQRIEPWRSVISRIPDAFLSGDDFRRVEIFFGNGRLPSAHAEARLLAAWFVAHGIPATAVSCAPDTAATTDGMMRVRISGGESGTEIQVQTVSSGSGQGLDVRFLRDGNTERTYYLSGWPVPEAGAWLGAIHAPRLGGEFRAVHRIFPEIPIG